MAKNKNVKRLGLFYRTHGRWTTVPYAGMTFTPYQVSRNPLKNEIALLKNRVLKSRVQVRPVSV